MNLEEIEREQRMAKLRVEFDHLWKTELKQRFDSLAKPGEHHTVAQDIAWHAFKAAKGVR